MGGPVADLHRIGVKLFAAAGGALAPREVVPIFHRWIQTGAVDNQLLIDVADYSHVPNGPGILLVAHQGNFSLDFADGRAGLTYICKQPDAGELGARLRGVARTALTACRLLEDDPAVGGRLRFRGEQLTVLANDRLRAPNTAAAREALRPALDGLLRALYGSTDCQVTAETDPRERLQLRVTAPQPVSVRELAERLA